MTQVDTDRASLGPHVYQPGAAPALVLLHGTGGDERDLVPLGRLVAPGHALFSPRGGVLENGMPRFFRRLAEGVFDEADVAYRADALADTVRRAGEAYGFARPIALGFSNGANIAAAVIARHPKVFSGAVLIRAQAPFKAMPRFETRLRVLLINGRADPLISAQEAERLRAALADAGADVEHRILATGHGLVEEDLTLAKRWLAERDGAG